MLVVYVKKYNRAIRKNEIDLRMIWRGQMNNVRTVAFSKM
jgi:hypothetical protein